MDENEIIRSALNVWANYIETRNIALSAEEMKELNQNIDTNLNHHQEKFVSKLREIAAKY